MGVVMDVKQKVVLGGLPQTVHLWSSDLAHPVLLFLHGGPGVPNRHTIRSCHLDLLDTFTLVAWDQRGCGGSYAGCDPSTLTLDRLVEDAAELVEYLTGVLGVEKVNLLGGSWGTELGTFLAYRHPERIGAYVGYGQVVDGVENEARSFAWTLEQAKAAGNDADVRTLLSVGPPEGGLYHPVFEGLMTQRKLLAKYGGHSTKRESYLAGTVMPILTSSEYTFADKVGIAKGYRLCLSNMWPTIVDYDFRKDCHTFQMPYYIFQGRHDNNTPASLIQGFYDVIDAPDKDLIWFEKSAHGPLSEEPEKFKRLLREKLG